MKRIFAAFMFVLSCVTMNAQDVKSYYCCEIKSAAAGQVISQVPTNQATCAMWWEDGSVWLANGTKWRYMSTDYQGNRHYRYDGSTGPTMPNTQYRELICNSNKTVFQINYLFGFGNMLSPMSSVFQYLGEGTSAAENWGR